MKPTKVLDELVRNLNKHVLLIEAAEAKVKELREKILDLMLEEELENVETAYGRVQTITSRSYDFSQYPEVESAKVLWESLKKKAQETAPVNRKVLLRFFPERELPQATPPKERPVKAEKVQEIVSIIRHIEPPKRMSAPGRRIRKRSSAVAFA
jgi:hypothetical protein